MRIRSAGTVAPDMNEIVASSSFCLQYNMYNVYCLAIVTGIYQSIYKNYTKLIDYIMKFSTKIYIASMAANKLFKFSRA